MATRNFNVKNGLTVGNITLDVSTNTANVPNLLVTGTANFTGASNVSLGSNSNVKITGGTAGYVLSTDGAGNLSWAAASTATAAGANTQIQFNDAGSFGASANFTFNKSTNLFTVTGNANVGNLNSSGRVRAVENVLIDGGSSEGGQLVIGWTGITGITGQANSTWNLDSDGSNNFRFFYQNAAGGTGVAMTLYSANANVQVNTNLLVTNGVTASTLTSNVATGTAPFAVSSTTRVANLNVANAGFADAATSATNAAAVQSNTSTSATAYLLTTATSGNANVSLEKVTGIFANLANNSITATTFVGTITSATNASAVLTNTSTNTQVYLTGTQTAGNANVSLEKVTGIYANMSNNSITATTFVGSLSGTATSALSATNAAAVQSNTSTTNTVYLLGTQTAANGNVSLEKVSGITANFAANSITATTFNGNLVASAANGVIFGNNHTASGAASGNINMTTITGNLGIRALASTYTDNVAAAGTIANAAIHAIAAPTVAASNNITTTNLATFYIANAPTASTNVTITNGYALYVAAGNSLFTANVTAGNFTTAGQLVATGNVVSSANLVSNDIIGRTGALTIKSAGTNTNINLQPNGTGNVDVNSAFITNVKNPTNLQDAATKSYVDSLVSTGIQVHPAVGAATTTTLATATGGTITYNNGAAGVGANLVTTGSFNLIDTANVQTVGTRILVKNETNAAHNGVYTWANATTIVRSTDTDTYAAADPDALGQNDYFFVSGGSVNKDTSWICSTPGTIIFGTTAINFSQFSATQAYSAGTGLSLSSALVFSIANTSVTAGSYGNGDRVATFTVNAQGQLTAAANVAITSNAANLTGTTLASTVVSSSLTSVGTLTSLSVTGNASAGNINTAGKVVASTLESNVATGTAPLVVTSTTRVANLNVANAGFADAATSATNAAAVQSNTSTTNTVYLLGTGTAANGNVSLEKVTGITANYAANTITATQFIGTHVGNVVANVANGTVIANNHTASGAATGNANVATITGNLGIRALFSTYTDNSAAASATIANAAIHALAAPNLAAANATVTFTNAATFYIAGAPVANTNATITNPYALYVGTGNSLFNGNVTVGNIIGNGQALTAINGANVTGTVSSATTAGTVTANAQGNITSVGTLTSLSVTGNISAGNVSATNGTFTRIIAPGTTGNTLQIWAGDQTVANGGGGIVNISGGNARGTGTGGPIYLTGGRADDTGGAGIGNGVGGEINIAGGFGWAGGTGGNVTVAAGQSTGFGANILLFGGGNATTGEGGNITINGGIAVGTDKNGGVLTIAGGIGRGAGQPGNIVFRTATATTSGTTAQTLANRLVISGNVVNVTTSVAATSTTSGALVVVGGMGVGGNVYAGAFYGAATGLTSIPGGNVTGTVPSATSATNAAAVQSNTSTSATTYLLSTATAGNANVSLEKVSGITANLANNSITATTFVGTLSGSSTSATNAAAVQSNTSTNNTVYLLSTATAGNANVSLEKVAGITANLANNSITATTFVGSLSGAATSATSATNAAAVQSNTTTNNTVYLLGTATAANGNVSLEKVTGITANFAANSIAATTFNGNVIANTANGIIFGNSHTASGAATGNFNVSTITGNLGIRALASTYTDNVAAAGTVANAAIHAIATPTLTAANAITTTNAATFYIANAPAASTNVTITNGYALYVGAGNSLFAATVTAGNLSTGGTLSVTGNANVGNLGTAGLITATGNVSGGNLTTTGALSVTGNANVGNLGTAGIITATGNITSSANLISDNILGRTGALTITSAGTNTNINLKPNGTGNIDANSTFITNVKDPSNPQDAATKAYVDGIAQGLNVHDSCYAATANTLAILTGGTITYNNGSSGVGANLTLGGTPTKGFLTANTFDGNTTAVVSNRILVKNEANAVLNGIYTVTSNTVLTRATDYDSVPEVEAGDFVFVTTGDLYNDTGWVQTSTVTGIGTAGNNISFTQFSGAGTYTAGTGLTLTGTVFSVNASQTQITSVGTLGTLSVNGNANVGNIGAATGVFTAAVTASGANGVIFANSHTASGAMSGNINVATVTGNLGIRALASTYTDNVAAAGTIGNAAIHAIAAPTVAASNSITTTNLATFYIANAPAASTNVTITNGYALYVGAGNSLFNGNVTVGNIIGNGQALTAINGSNVTGQVSNALVAGTVYTAAQPNITSVSTSFAGLTFAANGNITMSGSASQLSGANLVSATLLTGTLTTAAQGNITSVGTLTSLTVSGNANFDSGTLFVDSVNNRVGVNTSSPAFALEVSGSFAATTKSFVIDHPTKDGMKLRYGSLEGPENGVYVRGKLKGSNTIVLPDYWTGLVDEETITVNLTPIGKHQKLYVIDIVNNSIIIGNDKLLNKEINCFYTVFAERKDVDKLESEIWKN